MSCDLSVQNQDKVCLELLRALERARTRLAVAIATESKTTSPASWRRYVETDEQMRRCAKILRSPHRSGIDARFEGVQVLDSLLRLSLNSASGRGELCALCQDLHEILTSLEISNT